MTNYSRQNKKTNKDNQEAGKAGRHIKKGLSAFQKTLTLIGSVLGIITATITIMNAMKSNDQKKSETSSSAQTTTIIKEVEKETTTASTSDTTETSVQFQLTQRPVQILQVIMLLLLARLRQVLVAVSRKINNKQSQNICVLHPKS